MKTIALVMFAAATALAACATNQKVATNQLGDERLSCEDLRAQDREMNDVLERAQHNKGVSGANVAAVLFFWPAAVGNYMDADKAEGLVTKRKDNLAELYRAKGCGQSRPYVAPAVAEAAAPPAPQPMVQPVAQPVIRPASALATAPAVVRRKRCSISSPDAPDSVSC